MKCPVCGHELTQKGSGNITVDACEGGCGGIWFDRFELPKVDEKEETAGGVLLNIEKSPEIEVDPDRKRRCPRCVNIVMMRHFYSIKKQVLVDECPKCAGIWLDAGELAAIRNQFDSELEKEVTTEQYIQDVFNKYLGR